MLLEDLGIWALENCFTVRPNMGSERLPKCDAVVIVYAARTSQKVVEYRSELNRGLDRVYIGRENHDDFVVDCGNIGRKLKHLNKSELVLYSLWERA